jgi:hypothetical protein
MMQPLQSIRFVPHCLHSREPKCCALQEWHGVSVDAALLGQTRHSILASMKQPQRRTTMAFYVGLDVSVKDGVDLYYG